MRYSLEDPRRRLPSICQAPLRTGAPWLRVDRRDSGQRVVLTCRVSAEIIPGSVLWYKDGIAVHGDRARTADGHDTRLVIERAAPVNPYLQGYYWCEGISVPNFVPVESTKTLVRFPGVKTYACTMPLHGRHPELYEFSSNVALLFASDFRRAVLYAIRNTTVEGYEMYELQVVDVLQDTGADDVVRFLMFSRRLQRLPRMTSQDQEMRIIEFLRFTVMDTAFRLITSPPVLAAALSIKSTEMCFEDTTMYDTGEETILTWPATPIGDVAIPHEPCIQGDGQPVVRRCEGNFTTGAHWGDVQGMCERPAPHTTLELRNLSVAKVTNLTMVPTAERLNELTAHSENLGAQDVLYVATTLENIVSAGTIEVQTAKAIASTIDHVIKVDSQALQQSRSGNSTSRILTAIEEASAALSISTVIFGSSVAMGKVDSAEATRGIAIHLRNNQRYNFSDPQSLPRGTDAAFMLSEPNASVPRLAISLMHTSALFHGMPRNDTELEGEENEKNAASTYEVCTSVLQVKYSFDDGTANMTSNDARFSFYFRQTCDIVPDEIECAFWDINQNERLGSWSGDGCEYLGKVHEYHLCNCTHLTSFAVIFKYNKSKSGRNLHDAILSYFTLIGITVSALGLFMVILTYILFRKWRKGTGHQILFNLCLALVGALVSFVAMAKVPKHSASLVSCTCVGAALHYFLLVSFAWTFVEALLQYLRFVRVLGAYVPNLVLKAAFGAWGAPMLVILCVLIVNPMHYYKRKDLCWLDGEVLFYSFLLPVGAILVANVIVFCVIVFSIYCRRQKGLRSTQSQVALAKAQLRATICIVFLLGLTWIFAYLSLIEAVSKEWGRLFEYLFVVSSSLQGLVIFIFHIAYEKTAREFWVGHVLYPVCYARRKRSFDNSSSKITLSSSALKTSST
ncbi:adhesion G-protein coupled receptor G6 [Rhipicephalus sanguineus]|uniref:adhesion G-protein coupled receptor G6 n=1 Tax=Rhipicephalus sanguineus TaxID=34632 RepID=UPI0020C3D10D|nr:adhesion G-protein coupled receptor G6 [Rhipicephalus sanguineus]